MALDYRNELTQNAQGGTELMAQALEKRLSPHLLDKFQIIFSRVRNIDPNKIPILYAHDLPGDPESDHLKNGGWQRFAKIIFVSNWQMQAFIKHYNIPWARCCVLENAIEPIRAHQKPLMSERINFIYHTTPHRGLNILVPVFESLVKSHGDSIHLDVFSSFKAYGWEERDAPYKTMFDRIRNHPNMTYHGFQPNEVVREALTKAHVFAYPNTWIETSCIALIEAMSAGLICLHPNLGALTETGSRLTRSYQYQEDQKEHAKQIFGILNHLVASLLLEPPAASSLDFMKSYTNVFFSWDLRIMQWESLLNSME